MENGNWRFRRPEWAIAHFESSVAIGFPEPCVAIEFSMSQHGSTMARTSANDRNAMHAATRTTVVRSGMANGCLSRQTAHSPSVMTENSLS